MPFISPGTVYSYTPSFFFNMAAVGTVNGVKVSRELRPALRSPQFATD